MHLWLGESRLGSGVRSSLSPFWEALLRAAAISTLEGLEGNNTNSQNVLDYALQHLEKTIPMFFVGKCPIVPTIVNFSRLSWRI